jgi:hypothetical protein
MRRLIPFLAVCCMMICSSVLAEQIENPAYTSWAKYKPGTSTTMAMSSDMGGQASKMETKTTLKEVAADKLVIEMATSMEAAGQKMDMPAQKVDVPKMIDKPAAAAGTPPADQKDPKVDAKTSEETVTVGAGTFKAKVSQATMEQGGNKTVTKTWMSDDVPGGMVKMESTTEGPMKSTSKGELKAFDKK